MKKNTFVVEQKPLLAILSSMQPICTKRSTLEATTSILFHVGHKELTLKSTDLEISLQASQVFKENSFEDVESFLVSGRRLFDLVKELEGDISFTLAHQQLHVQSGSVNVSLNIKDAQEFPPFPERIENLMQLDAAFLSAMLTKVAFLIPQNNSNPALNGLFLEISKASFKLTATDGHCLAQVASDKYTLGEEKKWLLPRRAIFELKKILESSQDATVFLGVCSGQLVFSGEAFNFFTKLLVDNFPHYEPILQRDSFTPAVLDRSSLIKTLRRSSCLLSGQFLATRFAFEKEQVNVSLHNKEVGKLEECLPIEGFDGDRCDIRFYAPYLLSGLQVFGDQKVSCYLKNPTKPIIFEAHEDACTLVYLVMPVSPQASA